jgi:hypothetical protein
MYWFFDGDLNFFQTFILYYCKRINTNKKLGGKKKILQKEKEKNFWPKTRNPSNFTPKWQNWKEDWFWRWVHRINWMEDEWVGMIGICIIC